MVRWIRNPLQGREPSLVLVLLHKRGGGAHDFCGDDFDLYRYRRLDGIVRQLDRGSACLSRKEKKAQKIAHPVAGRMGSL